jgi:hypothetical protein
MILKSVDFAKISTNNLKRNEQHKNNPVNKTKHGPSGLDRWHVWHLEIINP